MLDAARRAGPSRGRCSCSQGDGLVDGITVVDGAVTVNMLPLDRSRPRARLQGLGLFSDVECPTLTADGDPDRADRRARGGDRPRRSRPTSASSSCTGATASPRARRRSRAPSRPSPSPSGRCGCSSLLTVVLVAATILVARRPLAGDDVARPRWRGGDGGRPLGRAAGRGGRARTWRPEPGGRAAIDAIVSGAGHRAAAAGRGDPDRRRRGGRARPSSGGTGAATTSLLVGGRGRLRRSSSPSSASASARCCSASSSPSPSRIVARLACPASRTPTRSEGPATDHRSGTRQ